MSVDVSVIGRHRIQHRLDRRGQGDANGDEPHENRDE
jgi:hypothetical protein